ncbi:replication initiator [Streptomyces sp. JJ38]|uniref:replication initiator n=1 Tax=Streptomyces sp. JJ38 TaxID=2738128 RepID=UPI0035ADEC0A
MFRFGRQIDVRAIRGTDFSGDGPVTDRHVAAYIAKYATKGAETTTGTFDCRLRLLAELHKYDITDHARRMIHTAWHLAAKRRHALLLRQWAHMLGFRGHFSTRTRHYSTTLTHLRAERTAWRTGRPDTQPPAPASTETQADQTDGTPVSDRAGHSTDLAAGHRPGHGHSTGHRPGHSDIASRPDGSDTTLVISHWEYAGTGLLPELEHLADLLAAMRRTRPEQPTRTRRSKRSGDRAGHPAGHFTDRLTSAVRTGAVA